MIILDIETMPRPEGIALLPPATAPRNLKDPAKIAAVLAEKDAERVDRAALDPNSCIIAAIGLLDTEAGEPWVWMADAGTEQAALETAWRRLRSRSATICGFNVGWDLRVLTRRAQLVGVAYPRMELGKYKHRYIDLQQDLTFDFQEEMRPLGYWCRLFGVPHDDSIKGADIPGLVAEGTPEAWAKVEQHLRDDLMSTTALAKRVL